MKYKKYPSYKDSGVEWLGEIPEHWNVNTIKSILEERKESNSPLKTENILSLCMYRGVIPYSEKGNSGNKAKEDLTAYKLAYPGDIVLNSMNVVAGSVGLSKYFGAVSPVYYMLRPRNKQDKVEFFNDIFQSESFQKSLFGLGNGIMVKESESTGKLNTIRMRIPMDKLNTVLIPYPPSKEQQQIANFLDKATAKIDTLIEKQTKQIELLKEKRQAVISHAVTKGINPNVPMKDSGVEWLGVIPEHWGTSPLKFLISEPLMYGANESADRDNPNDPRYIRITDIKKDGTLHEHTFKSLPIEIAKPYLLKENSLLLTRTGATVGKSFLYEISWGVACFAGYLIKAVISPNKALSKYVYYFTNTHNYWQWLKSSQIQATIENVSAEKYSSLSLPVPSLAEQRQIVEYIDDKTSKIDILIEKSNKSIELLKEKRTALISAAVTGKIDVREFE